MNPSQIKQQRQEARLKELLSEAIGTLEDDRISGLQVLEVRISRGKYDADIFLDGSDLNKSDRQRAIALLDKARGYLSRYVGNSEEWFKIPKFHFKFDDSINSAARIDQLFNNIAKRKGTEDESTEP